MKHVALQRERLAGVRRFDGLRPGNGDWRAAVEAIGTSVMAAALVNAAGSRIGDGST